MKRYISLFLLIITLSGCLGIPGYNAVDILPTTNSTINLGGPDQYYANLYVNHIYGISTGGSTNLTGTGTANTITKWTGVISIGDSSVTEAQLAASVALSHARQHSITSTLDHTSTATPSRLLQADANGLPVNATNTNAQVAGAVASSHTQNTDTILTTNGITALINAGTLKTNLAVDPGITIDGVDISTLGASSGNVTVTTGTNGKIVQFSGANTIINGTNTDAQVAGAVTNSHVINTDTNLAAVGTKNPPIDADKSLYRDSANLDVLVTSTFTQIKAFLKTYFDLLYASITSANVTTLGGTTNTFTKFTGANSIGNAPITDNGTINFSENVTLPAGFTVDGVDISTLTASGNVTVTTGITNRIPIYTGSSSINNSSITDNGTHVSTSENITTTQTMTAKQFVSSATGSDPPFVVNSGAWVGNLNVDQLDSHEGSYYANVTTANVTSTGGTANTLSKFTAGQNVQNSSITDNGTVVHVSANITLPIGYTVDGVDISVLAATSGNVTTIGGTNGKIVQFSGAGTIINATNTDAQVADAVTKAHTQGTDTALGAVGTKNPPIDADKSLYRDSANLDVLVTSTFTQIKAFLKTYFDSLYAAITSANVTTLGGTTNTLTKFTGANSIGNAPITDNGTINFSENVTLPVGYTVDGVDISTLAASSGNVTTVGGTANVISKFTGSSSIANSSLTDNGTTITSSANIALDSGKNLDLKKVLTANNSWSGLTTTGVAGENLVLGDVVYKDANSKLYKADASNVAKIPGLAIATGTINQDATGTFLTYGYMRYDTWTWTEHGVRIYLSATTTGAMTETPPTGANKYIQELAVIMDSVIGGGSADIIFFNPSFTYLMDTPANNDLGSAPTANWAYDHAASSGNVTTVGGTANTIPKFTGSASIANSSITDNGTQVTTTGNISTNTLIISTANGTAPITTNSSTLVTNLNADYLDGSHASAFATTSSANTTTTNGVTNTIPKYGSVSGLVNSAISDNGTINFSANVTLPAGFTVDGIDISTLTNSGNVTTVGGTNNYISKFTGGSSIANSSITDNGTTISTSSNITTSQLVTGGQIVSSATGGTPPFVVSSGQVVGNLNVDQVDGIEGADIFKKDGTVAMTGNLNMGVSGNITLAPGMTVDGVDISTLSASGNMTTSGGVVNYLPKYSIATNVVNSSISDNGTLISTSANITSSGGLSGLQIAISTANGTAPITTSSSTIVTNLNSDYLDGQHGSYYASASSANVSGSGTANTITKWTGASGLSNSILSDNGSYISTSGNITANYISANSTTPTTANQIANKDYVDKLRKTVYIQCMLPTTLVTTGNGTAYFTIPYDLNGMDLVDADMSIYTVSSANLPTVSIYNLTDSFQMMSTNMTIDVGEYSSYTALTQPVINTSRDDVVTGDRIRIDVSVAGTGTAGLDVILVFKLP